MSEQVAAADAPAVGAGAYRFKPILDWPKLPPGWSFVDVVGVGVDSRDRVYVFNRGEHPLCVFDRDGVLVDHWGEGQFTRPHGLTVTPDDKLWLTDDCGHAVYLHELSGQRLLTLGHPGVPSDTGAQGFDYRTIRAGGPPFNLPTNVALAADGSLYITDGYGNARVHQFTADGRLLFSWGEPGNGPGQFNVPHGIEIDSQGRVLVADRENSRIQAFSPEGEFLEAWTHVSRPMQVRRDPKGNLLVAETGFRAGMFPWNAPPPEPAGASVCVLDPQGRLLTRFGGGDDPCAPGDFYAPHDLCLDSHGDLYVGEVAWSAGGRHGLVAASCHVLQKFVRVN